MDAAAAGAIYGAETAVEGAVGIAAGVARPTMPLKASLSRIQSSTPLARSSHSLCVIRGHAYIFGGEISPREPVDNAMHVYTLPNPSTTATDADYRVVAPQAAIPGDQLPAPRVGHTASSIGDRIFVFGGRGGTDMKALEEKGRVWVFDTSTSRWSKLDPVQDSPYPEARSYHASVANEHPVPSKSQGNTYARGEEIAASDHGTLFVHAGCTASGRLSDLWAFDVASRTWTKFPDAPGPERGGPSLAFAHNKLFRFGGYDGKSEIGGQIDYLHIVRATFNDKGGTGEMCLSSTSDHWETISFDADLELPGNRSVAGLQPVTTGQGRNYLLLMFGERDPSSQGHAGAGKFWSDIWSFQLQPDGMTAASFKDATRQLIGKRTGEGEWAEVKIVDEEGKEQSDETKHLGSRGWFASAPAADTDPGSVIIWGGLNEDNERCGDGWIITVI
ncbi:galactose oxidase [Xylona heveae TC161]|uniref:Galactose oxidase n=1 Tax=Xylona heveae (strain CBS 132557 / TC161) TaxID=1328760 RepID=A0A165H1V2_XYLHT|nr:galactose oxidase [Xylona heveae TC161]KZF22874.1 galactose oxidase [Xylona heveae TC161]